MQDPQDSQVNRRFNELFREAYGGKKINLYASDANPRDKAFCFIATTVLAAQTTIAIAKVDWLPHVCILATGIIFAFFVSRKWPD